MALFCVNLLGHVKPQMLPKQQLGPGEVNGITGSPILLHFHVPEDEDFHTSLQHSSHHHSQTPAGGLELRPNLQPHHQAQTRLPITHRVPLDFHYTHPHGLETKREESKESQGRKQEGPLLGQRC